MSIDAFRAGPGWLAAAAVAALMLWPSHARAGQSHDNCVGYIDSLPAQLNEQGTWCMRANLTTSIDSGGAIQINLNNVVVDCNGYRIEHTLPGTGSVGISASGNNHTIRNCDVRGFFVGMLVAGQNHLIEDNRVLDSGHVGLQVDPAITIRRNQILRVGNHPTFEGHIAGIVGGSDIYDNLVDGVFANAAVNRHGFVSGISTSGNGVVTRNRIRNLAPAGTGTATGIEADGSAYITYNHIVGPGILTTSHKSINCPRGENHAYNNIANGWATNSISCFTAGGTNIQK